MILFDKLGVKLFYSTIYYQQTDSLSKYINKIIEIMPQFFLHILENLML